MPRRQTYLLLVFFLAATGAASVAAHAQVVPPKTEKSQEADPEDPFADDPAEIPDEAAEEDDEPGQFERWLRLGQLRIRNRFEWRYRRFTSSGFTDGINLPSREVVRRGTERDQAFRNLLEIETNGLVHDRVNTYLNLEWRRDIDGTRDPSFHNNIVTSYGDRDLLRLNSAYVEMVDVADHLLVRTGRQSTFEAHPVVFDGVWTRLDRFRLFGMPAEARAFGGMMVSDFSNLRQDGVFGGGLTVRPSSSLAFELRDTRYQRNRLETEVRWRPTADLSLLGMYGFYDGQGRDARFEAGHPVLGFDITAGYYERYAHDFRLDALTGQSVRQFSERYLFLPELAPYREAYVRVGRDFTPWLGAGAEYLYHRLRNGSDESAYDTDFDEWSGHVDCRLGNSRLRTEVRYYHAYRDETVRVSPGFFDPTLVGPFRVGERDHIEYRLNGGHDLGDTGWGVHGGIVWHRLNYYDTGSKVKHEQAVDYRLEVRGRLKKNITLRMIYENTRDMEYFSPYYERFQALSWILDVEL